MKKILVIMAMTLLAAQAQVIYVNQYNSPKQADGSSWENAYRNLNRALKQAKVGDDVWVAKGEYILKPTRLNGINIYGGFSAMETALSQREIVNNETKIFGRLALQDALVSSVTLLEKPEKHTVVEIEFNNKERSRAFSPNKERMRQERKERELRSQMQRRNTPEVFEEEVLQPTQEDVPQNQDTHTPMQFQHQGPSQENGPTRPSKRRGPPSAKEAMQMFDSNGDNKISKSEAPKPMQRDWNRLDRNKDGFIDETEIRPPKKGMR